MTIVAFTLAGGPTVNIHKRVTLKVGKNVLTLPITGEVVTHDDLADEWVTIKRAGKFPMIRKAGKTLATMSMTVVFQLPDGTNVDKGLGLLTNMARSDSPAVVAYSGFETGFWRITKMSFRSVQRRPDNKITRAEVNILFTRDLEYITPPLSAPKPKPKPKPKPATKPTVRHYTVRRGDTLSGIAVRYYHRASLWPRIASANHIRDPRKLRIGQVLIIP